MSVIYDIMTDRATEFERDVAESAHSVSVRRQTLSAERGHIFNRETKCGVQTGGFLWEGLIPGSVPSRGKHIVMSQQSVNSLSFQKNIFSSV